MERHGDYEINTTRTERLGEGSFGYVYKGTHVVTGAIVAAKCITAKEEFSAAQIEAEIRLMTAIKGHPNLLHIIAHCKEDVKAKQEFWIMSEYCGLGNLSEYSVAFALDTGHMVHIMEQISSALAFLHNRKHPILHRDVKPDNVLFKLEGLAHVARLSDFGTSRIVETAFLKHISTYAGTKPYMAPEIDGPEDRKSIVYLGHGNVDVFSAGLVFYQMIVAKPGKGIYLKDVVEGEIGRKLWKNRREHVIPDDPNDSELVAEIKNIIRRMIKWMPTRRPTMVKVEAEIKALKKSLPEQPGVPPPSATSDTSGVAHIEATAYASISHPPTATKIPTWRMLVSYKLLFRANKFTAFSNDGAVIENMENNKLAKLRLNIEQDEEGATATLSTKASYTEVWKKKRPNEMRAKSEKVLLHDGRLITRHAQVNVTLVYNPQLESPRTFTTMDEGDHLVAELPPDRLIYYKCNKKLSIHRVSDHQHLRTLQESVRSDWVSACRHPASKWFAISCKHGQTLDIYDTVSMLHRRVTLPFRPQGINALASVGDYIIIAEWISNNLYIYNWAGDEINHLTGRDLGVDSDIWGVGGGGEKGAALQIATEGSFHVFGVE